MLFPTRTCADFSKKLFRKPFLGVVTFLLPRLIRKGSTSILEGTSKAWDALLLLACLNPWSLLHHYPFTKFI